MTSPLSSLPAHTQEFEDAISVEPLTSHTYQANLSPEWCIGTVPHGGYTTAVLYRLSIAHFKHTHPTRHNGQPYPISIQLSFLRRTAAGPAILTVTDMKLGVRTSTIRVELSQEAEGADENGENKSAEKTEKMMKVRVAGYITVSDPVSEQGLSATTDWALLPPPPPAAVRGAATTELPPGARSLLPPQADIIKREGTDGTWELFLQEFSTFRRAGNQTECYGPDWDAISKSTSLASLRRGPQQQQEALIGPQKRAGIVDQWSRLRTRGPKGGPGRWTNEAVAYLGDMFPVILRDLGTIGEKTQLDQYQHHDRQTPGLNPHPKMEHNAAFWFPTVTLNIDFKKPLPPNGVEWIYSRITVKQIRNGRVDFNVVLLDVDGDVVATSTQVALVLSASRNIGRRSYNNGSKGKL